MIDNKKYILLDKNYILVKSKDTSDIFLADADIKTLNITLTELNSFKIIDNTEFFYSNFNSSMLISPLPSSYKLIELFKLVGLCDIESYKIASKAYHLMNWKNSYKYCPKCGSELIDKEDEQARTCTNCDFIIYPTISPAIITAVVKDNKLLLAHNTNFPKDLFSVIAGFVEPGETLEDCVKREVYEEIGIEVENIRYFSSQPWPFPNSLMIAFICDYKSGEIKVDGIEIDSADWYEPSDLPTIPYSGTMGNILINWFRENYS